MEAKFLQTKRLVKADIAAHFLIMFCCAFVFALYKNFVVLVLTITTIVIKDVIMYTDYHGKIIADENGVTIFRTFLGRSYGKKFIEYSKIKSTDCGIITSRQRGGGTSFAMEFTLKMRDGSKIVLYNTMKIGASLPAEQPDKYKEYLHEQPLMQISHYIDSKLHLNTTA